MTSARRRAASRKPAGTDSAIPADYTGPRLEHEAPDLCHRHFRTVIRGWDCDMCRDEDIGEPLPPWAKLNPARKRFVPTERPGKWIFGKWIEG